MNIHRLSKIVNGEIIYKNKKEIVLRSCIDSRELVNGGIFVVIGNITPYQEEIINKASVIIGEKNFSKKTGFIKVENSIKALKKLARYTLEQSNAKVIGITGSCGKTTLKELVFNILSTKYNVLKNNGNENNIIGVCKTLLRLTNEHEFCILEMGMNHSREISELSLLTNPKFGLITNIGTSHIGNLGSIKEIFKAKLEILDGMDDNNLIVNGDDKLLKHLKCLKVGKKLGNTLKIKHVNTNISNTEFDLTLNKNKYHIKTSLIGKHYPLLISMALLLGYQFDISLEQGIIGLDNIDIEPHRSQIHHLNKSNILIDDCYNASYESFKNVISLIKKEKNKKIFIIGDVLETGKFSENIHVKIIGLLNKVKNSEIWYTGDNFNKYGYKFKNGISLTKEQMIENINKKEFDNTIFIVKASNKYKLSDISDEIINKHN